MDNQNVYPPKDPATNPPSNSPGSNQNDGQSNQVANVAPAQAPRFNPSSIYPQATEDNPSTNLNNPNTATLKNTASEPTKNLSNSSNLILIICCVIIAIPLIISLTGHLPSMWVTYFAPNPIAFFSGLGLLTYKLMSVIALGIIVGVFFRKEQLRIAYLTLASVTFVISLYYLIKAVNQLDITDAKFYEEVAYSYIVGFVLPVFILSRSSIKALFS